MRITDLKRLVRDLQNANTSLQNENAQLKSDLDAATTALNADLDNLDDTVAVIESDVVELEDDNESRFNNSIVNAFMGATQAQLKNQFNWNTMSNDDKVRWEKILRLMKAIVKSQWDE